MTTDFNRTTMKKILLSVLAVAALAVTPTMAEDVAISAQKLPGEAHKFLKDYFANNKIVTAVHDKDASDNDYTVILDNGTKIEFDSSGKWESVKIRNGKMPAGLVPVKIQGSISEYYTSFGIEKIERKRYGYEVELTNDLDLKFSTDGRFIGVDD